MISLCFSPAISRLTVPHGSLNFAHCDMLILQRVRGTKNRNPHFMCGGEDWARVATEQLGRRTCEISV